MNNKGFTLLELIISITLLGLIVLITAGTIRLGYGSVNRGETKMETLERIRTSMDIIESQIQSQLPVTYNEDGVKKYLFKGDSKSLEFATNYSIWHGLAGYVSVAYSVDYDKGKQVLSASETIIGTEDKRETRLLDNFDDISFEYYYKDPTDEIGNWIREWPDDEKMPDKLKINFTRGAQTFSIIVQMRAKKFHGTV